MRTILKEGQLVMESNCVLQKEKCAECEVMDSWQWRAIVGYRKRSERNIKERTVGNGEQL